jgi:hypothetical protein
MAMQMRILKYDSDICQKQCLQAKPRLNSKLPEEYLKDKFLVLDKEF